MEDLCKLVLFCLLRTDPLRLTALVPANEYSISDLAHCVADEFGIHKVTFDATKADGQFKKTMSNAGLN